MRVPTLLNLANVGSGFCKIGNLQSAEGARRSMQLAARLAPASFVMVKLGQTELRPGILCPTAWTFKGRMGSVSAQLPDINGGHVPKF